MAVLRGLPEPDSVGMQGIAAHITPEGHWQFANRAGETFTAGTANELKRAATVLMPDVKDGFTGLRIVLSRDSLFAGEAALKEMPVSHYAVAVAGEALPLERIEGTMRAVRLRPNLAIAITDKDAFLETLAQLRHPIEARRVRLIAATTGAPATLTTTAKVDAKDGGIAIDPVDPDRLAEALASVSRQMAVVSGRVDQTSLTVAPASGPQRTIPLAQLTAAASASDVDLILLHADPPRQPGTRTWLWQRVQISGLGHAALRATMADFLNELASGRGKFIVSVVPAGDSRVALTARQSFASDTSFGLDGLTGWIRQATDAVTGQVTGAVTPVAIHANLVSDARRRELAWRLVPGVPSFAQGVYLAAALLGLLAWPVATRWFRSLWPGEARIDYDNARGFLLARAIRGVTFVALFLPLAAIPAFFVRLLGGGAKNAAKAAR